MIDDKRLNIFLLSKGEIGRIRNIGDGDGDGDVDGKGEGDLNGTDDVDGTDGARGNSEGISVDVSISVSVGNDDSEGDDDGEGEGDLNGTDDVDSARSVIDDDGEGRGDSFIFISANLSSDFFVFISVDGLDS